MTDLLFFIAKVIAVTLACIAVIYVFKSKKASTQSKLFDQTNIEKVNHSIKDATLPLLKKVLSKNDMKAYQKSEKKQAKEAADTSDKKSYFVIDFKGDIKATANKQLRQLVTLVLSIARPGHDEVILRLDSRGGTVTGYGLAASQLHRLKEKNIKIHAAIDEFAASGGYMMAVIASRIYASPFAMIGSIGVISEIPNFHRLLKKHDVDYEMVTAGKYKRTLTMLGKNTEQGREKYKQDLEMIHNLFIDHVKKYRPHVDNDVFTGEVWPASLALEHNLIDELKTSDDIILDAIKHGNVYYLNQQKKQSMLQKMTQSADSLIQRFSQNYYLNG